MPRYLHPGVYVKNISTGSRSITRSIKRVETSTAAFVGYVSEGPVGEPVLIYAWADYEKRYGGIRDTGKMAADPMGFSVSAFFQNGGSKAYVVRITRNWEKADVSSDSVDDSQLLTEDYTGVFEKFLKLRDIDIICLPDQSWAGDGTGNAVIAAATRHASTTKSCMVIIDPPDSTELKSLNNVEALNLQSESYSVLYYPWVKVENPFYNTVMNSAVAKYVLVPPCGFAAGIWARMDANRGVWKAPAGRQSVLIGATGFQFDVKNDEQSALNRSGVNCLRKISGAGYVIWGSRTLAPQAGSEWRYIPVRRTAIMIEQSIYAGTRWSVFESNEHRLWQTLRASIGSFMNRLFRAGAFQGARDRDAYFVRCGLGDTMTQGDVDSGQVIIQIGFAPIRPAEFVIIRIQLKAKL